jgi:hypothetical protein
MDIVHIHLIYDACISFSLETMRAIPKTETRYITSSSTSLDPQILFMALAVKTYSTVLQYLM